MMTSTDPAAAQLLALALEQGMYIGLRVQKGERRVLHLRLRSGEETRSWARQVISDDGLPDAIEELCGAALSTCAQRASITAPSQDASPLARIYPVIDRPGDHAAVARA